jgi:adenylate cyclase
VLFADLRGFTRLSEGRLPYDVVHLLNRYFKTMGRAIDGAGGHVDKVVGDGIMALFGLATDPATASRQALRAVKAMGEALDGLNREFAGDLVQPLRIAVGLHQGTAIVGELGYGASSALTAIGDAVNVASRLEGVAKEHEVELAVSAVVLSRAGVSKLDAQSREVAIRGRSQPLPVSLIAHTRALPPTPDEPASEPLRRLPAWRARGRVRGAAG